MAAHTELDCVEEGAWPVAPLSEPNICQSSEDSDVVTSLLSAPIKLYDVTTSEFQLMTNFPIQFSLPNKNFVANIAYPSNIEYIKENNIRVTRWRGNDTLIPKFISPSLNETLNEQLPVIEVVDTFFDYTSSIPRASSWYPNFANRYLFIAWDSSLLAQDELQVLEFPCFASLNMFLPREGALTNDGIGPTPILIENAVRRCNLDTTSSPSIYGNAFRRTSEELIRSRLTVLDPVVAANIYAFEAPPGGWGEYKRNSIVNILSTAFTAFSQIVVIEKEKNDPLVELHIGYWGCGAYGGNSVLMILIQLLAAKLAGIKHVTVHGAPSVEPALRAIDLFHSQMPLGSTEEAVDWLKAQKFKWGVSDGN